MKHQNIQKSMYFTVTLFIAVLVSCAPSTVPELKLNPDGKDTFDVNQPSEVIYRKILTNVRENYYWVEGDFFQDTKHGQITHSFTDAMGLKRSVWFTINIEPIDGEKSRVTTYYALFTWKKITYEVRSWCEVTEKTKVDKP